MNAEIKENNNIKRLDDIIALFPNSKEIIIGTDGADRDFSIPMDAVGHYEANPDAPDVEFSIKYKGKEIYFMSNETILKGLKSLKQKHHEKRNRRIIRHLLGLSNGRHI